MRSVWPLLAPRPTSGIWVAELPRCSGYVGGDDVGGVPVQAGPRAVVAHGGARVGVGGSLLHVAQRDPSVETGDETVPQCVRADVLGDPGAPGDPADDPGGAVPVQPLAVRGDKEGSFGALADRQVDRPGGARGEGDGDDLAALSGDDQGPVPALQAQVLDVRAGGLGYPQPVQRKQGDQRVLGGWSEPGSDQEAAEFVAVQRGGVRLVVQPGTTDVRRGRVVQEFLPRRRTCRTRRWCTAAA